MIQPLALLFVRGAGHRTLGKSGKYQIAALQYVVPSREVVFESVWRDLDAVKVAFGDAWQQSHLPEGYSALMRAYSVHHFLVSESSMTK